MDAALLPIGSYQPRWFMSVYHMDPTEAVLAYKELRAKVVIPQQWGVFDLTDEPMDLPPRDYRKAAENAGLTEAQAPLLRHGGTYYLQ
jgi:L-ascorbate metabolism protein UlaG (beta-lactamase superfamily)